MIIICEKERHVLRLMWCSAAAAIAIWAASAPASAGGDDKSRYTLFSPTPTAALRDMSTDRPDKTESPYTVDAGRAQLETDLVVYTRDHDLGVTAETIDGLPFNLKLGLTHDTDLQLVYGGLSRLRVADHGDTQTERGGGDLVIRIKQNVRGNDGGSTALAIMPFVKLPTNTLRDLNDDVEGGVIVLLAIDLGHGVGLGLMTEVDVLSSESGGGYRPTLINSATLSFELTQKLGLYTEIYTERSTEDDANTVVTFDSGITYAVTENLQLDAGVNVGLTKVADDIAVFTGLSQRF